MKPASRGARRSRTNALHWIGAAVVVGYVLWCWSDFSGPFRWLVDLQVRLTGRFYWEPLAVALLLVGLLLPAMLVADLLDPLVPRLKDRAWGWLFILAALVGSGFALRHAWWLWTAPETGATHRYPPPRTLDLDRLGPERMPPSVVRIVGRADPRDRIRLRQEPRGSHVYQPIGGLHRPASDLPAPVLATCSARRWDDCTPGTTEGWLVPARVDDRDSYRLRRAGVVKDAFYLLYPGLPKTAEWVEEGPGDRGGAIAVLVFLALFWLTIGITAFAPRPQAPAKAEAVAPAESVETGRAAPYALSLMAAACVFVLLTALGLIRWVYDLIPF